MARTEFSTGLKHVIVQFSDFKILKNVFHFCSVDFSAGLFYESQSVTDYLEHFNLIGFQMILNLK